MTRTDAELREDVEEELRWDPKVNAAQIAVNAASGEVTLSGVVDHNAQKWAAVDATKRVRGVRAVAQYLTVKLLHSHVRSDSEIGEAISRVLNWDVCVPDTVTATVNSGSVTLAGRVSWKHESDAAERAVRGLKGVVDVRNSIAIEPRVTPAQVDLHVQAALRRRAMVDSNAIHVETSGSEVTLTGEASSWQSIVDAEDAAWAAPGVTQVVDRVKLVP
jgi:osmotically-inducible protein OsmY